MWPGRADPPGARCASHRCRLSRRDPIRESRVLEAGPEHGLADGGPADVAEADDGDPERRGRAGHGKKVSAEFSSTGWGQCSARSHEGESLTACSPSPVCPQPVSRGRGVFHTSSTGLSTGLVDTVTPAPYVGDRHDGRPVRRHHEGGPVSVAELHPSSDSPGPDRTPPNDIAAEQSVLGAMLLSKDAIADVVEVLREGDFYRPAHADRLRGDPRPLRPRRAGRRRHRGGRAAPAAATSAASVAPPTCTPWSRWCRRRRTRATTAASCASRRSCAGSSRPAPASSQMGYAGTVTSTRWSTAPRPRSTTSPTGAPARTTRRSATSWATPSTRSRRSPTAAARWSACRPGSPSSTS